MTTFTTIPNSSLAQDRPFTQSISRALRDNPIAIAEGDGTAPEDVGVSPMMKATASNSASLVFQNLPDGYDVLEFQLVRILPSVRGSSNLLVMEASTDNGATWVTTGYRNMHDSGVDTANYVSLTYTENFDTDTANTINGRFLSYSLSSTTVYKHTEGVIHWRTSSGSNRYRFFGILLNTSKVNAVRFRFTSGNISSGYITMRRHRPA